MRAMLDTNVIVDALQRREPWARDAEEIFRAAANCRFTGCITAKACADIHYLTRRCTHSERIARETLNKLFVLFDLLDTAAVDCTRALASETSDYEDAVMIETAVREDVDCIVTRNLADFGHSPVEVLSPEAFLGLLAREDR